MKGLEIKEKMFSDISMNKDVRIDSSFYTTKIYKNKSLKYEKIKKILISTQYGVSIDMNENKDGYPIYRMNEIHNMLCDTTVSKYAKLSAEEFKDFKLNNEDVLFNRTNSYEFVGRTGIYYTTGEDKIFASYLVRFVPNKEYILPEYLTAFLNSKYGQIDIKRHSRQSINQTNVNPEEVKEIEIPIIKQNLQEKIRECFLIANEQRVRSEQLFKHAEDILNKELGIDNLKISNKTVSIKTFSEYQKTNRLDAEYYQPKYEILENKIRTYKNGYKTLENFIEKYSTGYPYKSNTYIKEGIPLIRINNIRECNLDLSDAMTIPIEDLKLSPKDIVKENDILISMSGTIGNSCKIEQGVKAVVNQRIMKITPKNYNFDVLPLIINSIIGQYQLKRIGTGGVQTNISANDINNILIPILPQNIQTKIAEVIQESFKSRQQSKDLLNLAKQIVETTIEKGETEALKLIKNN